MEYCPCVIPNKCSEIIEEFITTTLGPFNDTKISAVFNYSDWLQLPDQFTPCHSTAQYVTLFKSLGFFATTTSKQSKD